MIKLRKYQPEDGEPVRALITEIMAKEFPQSASAFPLDDLHHIEDVYGKLGEAFFVAMDGSKIVGTVAVKREDDRVALLRRIFVSPTHRKQMIGMRLIERAIEFCREVGYQEIIFKTSSKMDGAIRLCQKNGFHQRAKLEMGGLELLKFVLLLNHQYETA